MNQNSYVSSKLDSKNYHKILVYKVLKIKKTALNAVFFFAFIRKHKKNTNHYDWYFLLTLII